MRKLNQLLQTFARKVATTGRGKIVRQKRRVLLENLESRQMFAADLRTFDGTGNNLKNTEWGSTEEQFLRIAPAQYADGKSAPAGASRISAREISNLLAAHPATETLDERGLSAFVYAWGQFLDHDIDLTNTAPTNEAFSIQVPKGDPSFDPNSTGSKVINLLRSEYAANTGLTNARQQVNDITAYIDGSMIYGSSKEVADSLRTFSGGKLKTSDGNLLPMQEGMFVAGDIRVNENPELTSMHTLFVREHNRIATKLAADHPTWTDEQLYQEARRIVIGEIQAITYNEFLPALLGPEALRPYRGYNPQVNAGISNEFATAAYRFGHSMLGSDIEFLDNDGNEVHDPISLRDAFFNPGVVLENGIDEIVKYLASDVAETIDTRVIDDVRNFLFGPPGSGGLDLAALNIQRGRDHGLADYNSVRAAYGLPKVRSFADITKDVNVQRALQAAYKTVDNIDLWVGGLAESHVRGASVGPLFQRILADQFTRLRDGDRFWYERDLQGSTLAMVRSTKLSDIIKRNTTTQNVQDNVFFFRTSIQGRVFQDANNNRRIDGREQGIANLTVNLVNTDGQIVATTKTARDGTYRFERLDLGKYKVVVLPAANNSSTTPAPLATREVSLTKGQELNGIDVGVTSSVLPPLVADNRR